MIEEEPLSTRANGEYNADSIQVLGGREAVRRRPGMYIGSTDSRGLHHMLYEIAFNSVDEAMAGRCDKIIVIITKDNVVSVEDNAAVFRWKSTRRQANPPWRLF